MARFLDNHTGTLAKLAAVHEDATTPVPDQSRDYEESSVQAENRTAPHVKRLERGDEKIKDLNEVSSLTSNGTVRPEADAATRREVAERISKAIGRVVASCGKASMAADLELLKRELSRSHDILRPLSTEGDYLSIVVLVESELGIKPWKEITKQELTALKSAIDIGVKQVRVNYDDFNQKFRILNASGWSTGPVLDLGEFRFDQDDEELPED